MKWFLRIFPIVVVLAAAGAWFGLGSKRIAGLVLGGGAMTWIAVGAFAIGSKVEPKDRGGEDG